MLTFEALLGIKMNFEKTEMYPLNLDHTSQLAQIFGCPWGSFPISYLGLPLHNKKLLVSDWHFLVDKIEHKLQHWKGQMLSSGGRMTLINSVLSAVPLYTLSIYKVPKTIIARIDRLRRRFLWQGSETAKKKICFS